MANVKISALTAGAALDGTEIVPIVQSATTKRTTVSAFLTWIKTQAITWTAAHVFSSTSRFDGLIGIGAAPTTGKLIQCSKTITGAVTSYGFNIDSAIQSDVTTLAAIYSSSIATQAAAFTLATLRHFRADQGTFGAGSTVTTQSGFHVSATLIGATNNYGFTSDIPAGTNRWNFYAGGTARNYMAGLLSIGSTTDTGSGALLQVTGMIESSNAVISGSSLVCRGGGVGAEGGQIVLGYGNNASTTITGQVNSTWNIDIDSGNALRIFRQSAAGSVSVPIKIPEGTTNILIGATVDDGNKLQVEGNITVKPAASVTPADNGDMTFELTSDTELKIKVKGNDGVVRSVSLTLA